MFSTFKKINAIVLSGALLATLGMPGDLWARGGGRGGGGGGGGFRGGYSGGGGGYRSYSAGGYGGGANRGYSGGYSAGFRGTTGVGAGVGGRSIGAGAGANGGFASRHFSGNQTFAGNAGMNRAGAFGAYGGMGPYGMGYGGLGYGMGYGGLGYGMGYPFFGMYGLGGLGMMGMGMGMGGYGGGYGGGGYGGGGGYSGGGYAATDPSATAPQTAAAPTDDQVAQANSFDAKGEADFKAGNYQAAVQDWQHALIDTPHSGGAMLLLAQSLFATGQYQPAAGAVQLGMQMLPQDQWGNVVKHYSDLYPDNQAFTDQLRGLENARTAKPDDPALRFLLGYEYGYLGYPKQAVAELDQGIKLRPQDRGAVMIRNQFAAQAGISELPLPALPTPPAAPGGPATQPTSAKPTTG